MNNDSLFLSLFSPYSSSPVSPQHAYSGWISENQITSRMMLCIFASFNLNTGSPNFLFHDTDLLQRQDNCFIEYQNLFKFHPLHTVCFNGYYQGRATY